MAYTEADFQQGRIIGFFTDNLKWKEGLREEVDRERWLISSDLLWFLQNGNPSNANSYDNLIKEYDSGLDLVEDFIKTSLLPKITSAPNAASILREQISFNGQTFTLFNEPNIVGSSPDSDKLFDKNVFKVIQEAIFDRHFEKTGKKLNRKPDLTFFINGIYFSYSELKLSTQGQTASNHGREKIAHNFIEAITASIESILLEEGYDVSTLPSWSEISTRTPVYNKILQSVSLFAKATHITTVDDSNLYIINDITKFIPEIYEGIKQGLKSSQAIRLLKEVLPEKIKKDFQKMPALRDKTSTQSVMIHLATLYDRSKGIYWEIEYFNSINRDNKLIRPRAAQRVIMSYTDNKIESIYLDEFTPALSPDKIRLQLSISLPNLSGDEIDNEIKELLKYKNGQDQHSLILQGAAGLGKTNLIVWLAYQLTSKYHPAKLKELNPILEPLFDTILILTDRTELRANIAKDAHKSIAVEATTTKELVEAIKSGAKIIIYNIQKTAGLKSALNDELKDIISNKRFAFIIDEVHRSQNGELNKDTMEIFDACASIKNTNKKNLIIGLTATPTEEILAKYGEWRSNSGPTDTRNWVPHFSYTMKEAIEEGYILNPTLNIMTVTDTLEFINVIGDAVSPSMKDIYSNPNRQKLAAKEIAKIFVRETMPAIKAGRGRNSGRGEGKAIVAESSINVAIQMLPLIKEALKEEAQSVIDNIPPGATIKTYEAAYAKSELIKNVAVTIVYSDTQGVDKCSEQNDGLNQEAIIKKFRCENSQYKNSIMIVVDKLLTGFDEPTLHTIFLNKNISDVGLFQAVCRVNRIYQNKTNCLVVDISHDNTVAQEIPAVFKKYGGITVSDFDAGTWQEKINRAYNFLFLSDKNKDIMEQFQLWKNWTEDKKSELPVDLIDKVNSLVGGLPAELEKAIDIWKNCSQWLSTYDKLKYLLDFTDPSLKKHTSKDKREFIRLLRKLLYAKIQEQQDGKSGEIVFDVVKLEETYGATIVEDSDEEEEKPTNSEELKRTPGTTSIDAIDILGMLQKSEDDKEKIINEVQTFMKGLFSEIDIKSKESNNDSFRKKIKSGDDMSWEDKLDAFRVLYLKATSGVSKVRLNKITRLYTILDASFKTKMSLLESDYEAWVLGESSLILDK